MKNILVTGGAGFLGSHLCDRLIEQGHNVICLDNLFTGSMDNIEHLMSGPRFTFFDRDVTLPIHLKEVDQIYNLACPASPVHYQHDPIKTIQTNVLGAINVLELAKHTGARVVQASTSEVYGDPEVHPQTENYWGHVNPIGLRSCYDEGKRCAETLFFDYHRHYGVSVGVARIFNTYGPRMREDDGRVVSNFITQAITGKDITIYGSGKQTRSFCYVDDLIRGLISLMESKLTGPFNIGNPIEWEMTKLAEKIINLTGSNSNLVFRPLPSDDPHRRKPSILAAKKHLNWEPTVELEDGLIKTIEYFKGELCDTEVDLRMG